MEDPTRGEAARLCELCARVFRTCGSVAAGDRAAAFLTAAKLWAAAGRWDRAAACADLSRKQGQVLPECSAVAAECTARSGADHDGLELLAQATGEDGRLCAAAVGAATRVADELLRGGEPARARAWCETALENAPDSSSSSGVVDLLLLAAEAGRRCCFRDEAWQAAEAATAHAAAGSAQHFDALVMQCVCAAESGRRAPAAELAAHVSRHAPGIRVSAKALARAGLRAEAEVVLCSSPPDSGWDTGALQRLLFDVSCAAAGVRAGRGTADVPAGPDAADRTAAAEVASSVLGSVPSPSRVWEGVSEVAGAVAAAVGRLYPRSPRSAAVQWLSHAARFGGVDGTSRRWTLDLADALSADGRHDDAWRALRDAGGVAGSPRGGLTATALHLRAGASAEALEQLSAVEARVDAGCVPRAAAVLRVAVAASAAEVAVAVMRPLGEAAPQAAMQQILRATAESCADDRNLQPVLTDAIHRAARLLADGGAAPPLSPSEQAEYVVRAYDGDGDGRLRFEELAALFQATSGEDFTRRTYADLVAALYPTDAAAAENAAEVGLSKEQLQLLFPCLESDYQDVWRRGAVRWWWSAAWRHAGALAAQHSASLPGVVAASAAIGSAGPAPTPLPAGVAKAVAVCAVSSGGDPGAALAEVEEAADLKAVAAAAVAGATRATALERAFSAAMSDGDYRAAAALLRRLLTDGVPSGRVRLLVDKVIVAARRDDRADSYPEEELAYLAAEVWNTGCRLAGCGRKSAAAQWFESGHSLAAVLPVRSGVRGSILEQATKCEC
eukprot:TRINITY_DN23244_c0_g1_i1.p1 TRINITY_DN23244_c0_g1~~TRINITY_DN23244_c0_g1_i1.p1  ORF type:complete len:852 (+),score=295.64 TRINITY_DN23244_c0_g1_i1:198-2558(+)